MARGELPRGRADLPARKPAAARAAASRARQAAPARPLGNDAGPQSALRACQPAHPPARRRRIVHRRTRARRPGDVRKHVARGLVHAALALGHAGRGGHAEALPAVLVPRGSAEPCRARDAGIDSRGRRARLRAQPCLRRRARQSRSARRLRDRRRRGRDGPACGQLAREQVPRPGDRRRRPADPASERLEDREPDRARPHRRRRARRPAAGLRASPDLRRAATIPRVCIRRWRRRWTRPTPTSAGSSARRASTAQRARPRWPAIVLRTPKGWTGPASRRRESRSKGTWRAHQVPLAGTRENPEHLAAARALDAELPAGGALRRRRLPGCGDPRTRPGRAEAHGVEPAREWRRAAARARPARLPRLRGRGAAARGHDERGDARPRRVPARGHAPQLRGAQLPPRRPGRNGLQSPRRGARGRRAGHGWASARRSTRVSRPTGA